jgi:hypothetical protein
MAIWYIFPRFGTLFQEKSGNPASELRGSEDACSHCAQNRESLSRWKALNGFGMEGQEWLDRRVGKTAG